MTDRIDHAVKAREALEMHLDGDAYMPRLRAIEQALGIEWSER